jgi:hypothetical protein
MNVNDLLKKFDKQKIFIVTHIRLIAFIVLVGVFSFMLIKIYWLASAEPTSDQVDEKISSLRITKLDEDAVSIIQSLQDRNISIESLFDNGRTNPFEQ